MLNELDDLMESYLRRRVAWWRQQELVDEIERLLEIYDNKLLRDVRQP